MSSSFSNDCRRSGRFFVYLAGFFALVLLALTVADAQAGEINFLDINCWLIVITVLLTLAGVFNLVLAAIVDALHRRKESSSTHRTAAGITDPEETPEQKEESELREWLEANMFYDWYHVRGEFPTNTHATELTWDHLKNYEGITGLHAFSAYYNGVHVYLATFTIVNDGLRYKLFGVNIRRRRYGEWVKQFRNEIAPYVAHYSDYVANQYTDV